MLAAWLMLLAAAYCVPPLPRCLLPSALCPLPSALCLLPSARYRPTSPASPASAPSQDDPDYAVRRIQSV
ncbi:hypothetical protein EN871_18330 [bacterium M00.F.Ca.ET.228.01.1.1]|nr:hypothetical protein EN871_18330 [bacterium M00.F.Ca.ET.228.01.1.1]TGR99070.1 hypothetical protein EN834_20970 [bacterium M00.F.Ca.ET.191.01.1.1]TGU03382.1 hypothetical protein EN798_21790 [bacterium M00.F.Ca.ET.155.01.1.1]